MKTFSVAVAVAVVLTVIYIQESSAFPSTGVTELEEPIFTEFVADHQEAPVESLEMPVKIRQKRGDCGTCCNMVNGKRICTRCCWM